MKLTRERLFLATIADDAPAQAQLHGLGLELDEFCTAMNMDACFDEWDARARDRMRCADRFLLHAAYSELTPCAVDPMVRQVSLHRFRQAAALCESYGISRMIVHSGFIPHVYFPEWFVEQGAAFFQELLSGLPENFQLLIENVLDPDPQPLLDLVNAIGDSRAALCLDAGHANVVSETPVSEWIDQLAPHLRHYHLHDNDGTRDAHALPGDGCIGFPALFEHIARRTPEATITFECRDAAGCVQRLKAFGLWA